MQAAAQVGACYAWMVLMEEDHIPGRSCWAMTGGELQGSCVPENAGCGAEIQGVFLLRSLRK